MRAVEEAERPAPSADEAILPRHAWMVGVAVDDDGTLLPPPIVPGSMAERGTGAPDAEPDHDADAGPGAFIRESER